MPPPTWPVCPIMWVGAEDGQTAHDQSAGALEHSTHVRSHQEATFRSRMAHARRCRALDGAGWNERDYCPCHSPALSYCAHREAPGSPSSSVGVRLHVAPFGVSCRVRTL